MQVTQNEQGQPRSSSPLQSKARNGQGEPKRQRTAVKIDKIKSYPSKGFCLFCRDYTAGYTEMEVADKVSAAEYEDFVIKGFLPYDKQFIHYNMKEKNCCAIRSLRTRALEFKPSKDTKKKVRRFESFLKGNRSLKPQKGNNKAKKGKKEARSEESEVWASLTEEGVKFAENALEKAESWLRAQIEGNRNLFDLFVVSMGDSQAVAAEVKNVEKIQLKRSKNEFEVFTAYFTTLYHKNRQSLTKSGVIKVDDYPGIQNVAQNLQNSLQNFINEQKLYSEENQFLGDFLVRFDLKRLSFALRINPEVLSQHKNVPTPQKDEEETQASPTKPAPKNSPENPKKAQGLFSNPPTGLFSTPPSLEGLFTSLSTNSKKTRLLSSSTTPARYNRHLVTYAHPFEGPDEAEWYSTNPIDPYSTKPHKFSTKLVKASYSTQKFAIYQRYNKKIHQEWDCDFDYFKRVECRQCFWEETLRSPVDPSVTLELGAYHLELYLDQKLVGVASIKIVHSGLVSDYFFYEPELKPLGLGVISVIKEIEVVQQKNRYFPDFKYYYMGAHLHEDSKVNYKANYQPIDIWCPITDIWVPWSDEVVRKLDAKAVRIAGEEDVRRVERMQGEELEDARIYKKEDYLFEDLVGLIGQFESMQRVYLLDDPSLEPFCDKTDQVVLEGGKYSRLTKPPKILENLINLGRIGDLGFYQLLGVTRIFEFDWYFWR